NRALLHCEQPPLTSVTEDSTANTAVTFAYDKVRRAELRRNVWRFSTKKVVLRPVDVNTMILQPTLYSSTTTYYPGSIVSDVNGFNWISLIKDNLGNTPGGNNEAWDAYFGPMTIEPWNGANNGPPIWLSTTTYYAGELVTGSDGNVYSSIAGSNLNNNPVGGSGYWTATGATNNPVPQPTSYFIGELVYMPGAFAGQYVIYQSLVDGNTTTPNYPAAWSASQMYHSDQIVSYSGSQWVSQIEVNINIAPTTGPAAFVLTTVYSAGNQVTGSDNAQYQSVGNSNVGNDPTTTTGFWTALNVVTAWAQAPTALQTYSSDVQWQVIFAKMKNLTLRYPIGSGPLSQSETKNLFRLPSGYLNIAPQDPKAGSVNFLGAPSGQMYKDWELDSSFIVSRDAYPIVLRFVADLTKVRDMDDMFCEGLACRVAVAIIPRLSSSNVKTQTIASAYQLFMGEARRANLIETGPIEPPEDDFITCRM